ncbi:MAG: ribonuclease HII [Rhizobiaceae bacterium]|nr:ribonuclease HII [Rhizobiaceae bacterium]MCV0406183.1 ribonuclease HII [Rhizobiaceae bacterium]
MPRARSDSPFLFDFDPFENARPDFRHETIAERDGLWPVAGLDEAGRGPLAGPVVAAAVILDPAALPVGLDDSKRLTADAREILFEQIVATALAVSTTSISASSIDATDIRKASLEAMRRAYAALPVRAGFALVDGRDIPPGLPTAALALVKGDRRSMSVAAASIVAKVMRDRIMQRCCARHTAYGFGAHKGYATAAHCTAIEMHGPLARIHRFSFAPIRR